MVISFALVRTGLYSGNTQSAALMLAGRARCQAALGAFLVSACVIGRGSQIEQMDELVKRKCARDR